LQKTQKPRRLIPPFFATLVANGRVMPTWTYFYLCIVVAGGLFSVYANKHKTFYYISGEILSVASFFALFFSFYSVIQLSQPVVFSTLFLLYLIYWESWENRHHYYFYWTPASEFAKTVELGEGETLENAVQSIKIIKYASVLLIALLVLPVLFVYYGIVINGN
jgi:hypothetical protein